MRLDAEMAACVLRAIQPGRWEEMREAEGTVEVEYQNLYSTQSIFLYSALIVLVLSFTRCSECSIRKSSHTRASMFLEVAVLLQGQGRRSPTVQGCVGFGVRAEGTHLEHRSFVHIQYCVTHQRLVHFSNTNSRSPPHRRTAKLGPPAAFIFCAGRRCSSE
jgi:hypothetical protein